MGITSVTYANPEKNSFTVVADGVTYSVFNDPSSPQRQAIRDWTNLPGNTIGDYIPGVPMSVSNYQARTLLIEMGLFAQVDKALRSSDQTQTSNQIALTAWDYANDYYRKSAFVEAMGSVLGLNDAQVDQMFISAAKII